MAFSLIPEHPNYSPAVLPPILIPTDLSHRQVLPPVPAPLVIEELRPEYAANSAVNFRSLEELTLPPDNSFLAGGGDGLRLRGIRIFGARTVSSDETTNPPSQPGNGELVALVGVAPGSFTGAAAGASCRPTSPLRMQFLARAGVRPRGPSATCGVRRLRRGSCEVGGQNDTCAGRHRRRGP